MRARCAAPWLVASLLLLLLLLLLSATAGAADPPRSVRLDYSRGPAAERCPEEQAFRDAIGAKVARDLFAAEPPPSARLIIMLGRRGAGYEGAAELRDAAGVVTWTKVLPGPSHPPAATCASLIDGLAFAVSVEVDPVVFAPVAPPLVAPPPTRPKSTDDQKPPAPADVPPGPFRLGVSPWVDVGTAPRPAFGLSWHLGYRVAWFSLDLEGRWDPPAASTIDGAEVTTSRLVGALVPCGHVGYFAGCLLAEVGSISGTLTGPRIHGDPHSALYAAPGIRLSAEVPIAPHLTLRPAIDLLLALQQPVFRVAGVGRWAVPAVAAGFGLGLFASF